MYMNITHHRSSTEHTMMNEKETAPMRDEISRFFEIPQELRDEIYRLAFANETNSYKIVLRSKWMQNERSRREMNNRRQQAFFPRVARPCPLLGMLVNKQFFEEAVSQWLSSTIIECHESFDVNSMIDRSTTLRENLVHFRGDWTSSTLLSKTRWHMYSCLRGLRLCQNMRTLHLTVTEGAFEAFESRLSCVDSFVDADFKTIMEVRSMLAMRSLTTVTLEPEKSKLAFTDGEKQQWVSNVNALEKYINRKLKERDAKKKLQTATTSKHAREEENLDSAPVKKMKAALNEAVDQAIKERRKPASSATTHGDNEDCRSILGFTRHHPVAAAMITTAFTLSIINSIVLAKQLA